MWEWLKRKLIGEAEEQETPAATHRLAFPRHKGTLPCSINLRGKVFRYQKKDFVFEGEDLWKCFQEGEWKWEAQHRFAGIDLIGHFASITPLAARAEVLHYNVDMEKYTLLQMNGSIENVLDLTEPGNCGEIRDLFDLKKYFGDYKYYIDIFTAAFDAQNGGSAASDILGWQAVKRGYNGILYPSLRAQPEDIRKALQGYVNPNLYRITLSEMMDRWDRYNIVVFSGARLLASMDKYLFHDRYEPDLTKWKPNPFFAVDPSINLHFNDEGRLQRISKVSWRPLE